MQQKKRARNRRARGQDGLEASLAVTSLPPPLSPELMVLVTPHQVTPGVLWLGVLPTLTPARLSQQDLSTALTRVSPQKSAPKPPYSEFNMRKQINVEVTPGVLCPP